jgi:hypothetical protein
LAPIDRQSGDDGRAERNNQQCHLKTSSRHLLLTGCVAAVPICIGGLAV